MPAGSFLLAYLAQTGHLDDMLDEIDAQKSVRSHGLRATVLRIHRNLVLVRFDPTNTTADADADADADSATSTDASHTSVPSSFLHPLHTATVWLQPRLMSCRSLIGDASKQLRRAGSQPGAGATKWSVHAALEGLHRRTALILDDLSQVPKQLEERIMLPLVLPPPPVRSPTKKALDATSAAADSLTSPTVHTPTAERIMRPPGAFTLLSSSQLLYTPSTSSPLPNGVLEFLWDRHAPPSRAYLKVWEALTRLQLGTDPSAWARVRPQPGQVVLDLGSAPSSAIQSLHSHSSNAGFTLDADEHDMIVAIKLPSHTDSESNVETSPERMK
jgi:hypothetical protein